MSAASCFILSHVYEALLANQPDIVVVDKKRKKAIVRDVVIPSDGNTRKREDEKLDKYQGLEDEGNRRARGNQGSDLRSHWSKDHLAAQETCILQSAGEWLLELVGRRWCETGIHQKPPFAVVANRLPPAVMTTCCQAPNSAMKQETECWPSE